jgi:hypothetical protein
MFTPRYARPRGRSHITHIVSTYVLSSPEGSENLALSPRRPEGRRATLASVDPPDTCTNAARYLLPVVSVLLTLCTLSAAAPVEGRRVGNLWAAAELPPSEIGLFESDSDS